MVQWMDLDLSRGTGPIQIIFPPRKWIHRSPPDGRSRILQNNVSFVQNGCIGVWPCWLPVEDQCTSSAVESSDLRNVSLLLHKSFLERSYRRTIVRSIHVMEFRTLVWISCDQFLWASSLRKSSPQVRMYRLSPSAPGTINFVLSLGHPSAGLCSWQSSHPAHNLPVDNNIASYAEAELHCRERRANWHLILPEAGVCRRAFKILVLVFAISFCKCAWSLSDVLTIPQDYSLRARCWNKSWTLLGLNW